MTSSRVVYDPTHPMPQDVLNAFVEWVMADNVSPHVSSTGALLRPKMTTREVFRELVKDN